MLHRPLHHIHPSIVETSTQPGVLSTSQSLLSVYFCTSHAPPTLHWSSTASIMSWYAPQTVEAMQSLNIPVVYYRRQEFRRRDGQARRRRFPYLAHRLHWPSHPPHRSQRLPIHSNFLRSMRCRGLYLLSHIDPTSPMAPASLVPLSLAGFTLPLCANVMVTTHCCAYMVPIPSQGARFWGRTVPRGHKPARGQYRRRDWHGLSGRPARLRRPLCHPASRPGYRCRDCGADLRT